MTRRLHGLVAVVAVLASIGAGVVAGERRAVQEWDRWADGCLVACSVMLP